MALRVDLALLSPLSVRTATLSCCSRAPYSSSLTPALAHASFPFNTQNVTAWYLMVEIVIIYSSKPIEYVTKGWALMKAMDLIMYQYYLISCDKCSNRCKVLIIGETGEMRAILELSVLYIWSFCKPKTALKMEVY